MAGHSRSKNGFASLAYVPAIHVLLFAKDVDAQHKVYTWAGRRPDPCAGHDDFTQTGEGLEDRKLLRLRLSARQLALLLAQQLALDVGEEAMMGSIFQSRSFADAVTRGYAADLPTLWSHFAQPNGN